MIVKSPIFKRCIFFIFFFSSFIYSQPVDSGDDVQDVPTAAPIADWLYPVLFLGWLYMFFRYKKFVKY
ncbi:hypothetical protein NAT47_04730 [Flavobacterium sp. HXWNR69]|uniref:Uncharacterized protein n=1 Tax=Flavobacterium fragile TaxID=2949085 RepID=A0ABT0TFF3_9FLAO|nr:hypothetical protein [Flavobacterium sp. HXWNR69]MCL9769715.1 hypothetical protein [Flavobacterium sp. HXWNR69]